MKIREKVLISVACLTLFGSAVSLASDTGLLKPIEAEISYGTKLTYNNQDFAPKKPDGSVIKPIKYEGKYYMPIDEMTKLLGTKVKYNAEDDEFIIGEVSEVTYHDSSYFKEGYLDKYAFMTSNIEQLYVGEKFYKFGILSRELYAFHYIILSDNVTSATKVGGTIYISEGKEDSYTIRIRKSNGENREVLAMYEVQVGVPFDFELDCSSADYVILDTSDDYNHDFTNQRFTLSVLDPYYK